MQKKMTLEEVLRETEKETKVLNISDEELLKRHEHFMDSMSKLKQILQDAKNENR